MGQILSCPFTVDRASSRILWEFTGKCNLNCRHCLYYGGSNGVGQDLTREQITPILDSIAREGSIKAIWISGGEPLLRRELMWFVEAIAQRGMTPSISSNATLVTEEMARSLYRLGVRYVHVSLDGADAATHDALRRAPGAFDAALAGIDRLTASGIQVGASCMVTEESAGQLDRVLALAKQRRVSPLSFYTVAPIGRGTAEQPGNLLALMEGLAAFQREHSGDQTPRLEVFRTLTGQDRLDKTAGLRPCNADSFFTISNTGRLSSCPWLSKSGHGLGSISLLETDFSTAAEEIRRETAAFLRRRREALPLCGGCAHRDVCGRGCPAVSLPGENDPLCRFLL